MEATALSGALEDESDVVVAYRLRSILDDTKDRMDQAGHYALSRVRRIGINCLDAGIGINSRDEEANARGREAGTPIPSSP